MAKLAERGRAVGIEERWDPDGLEELRALYEPLRRFAAVVARWDVDPDDVVQDAYARVLRQCRADINELGPYLRKTIVHLVSDSRRSARRAETATRRLGEPELSVDEYPSDLDELMRLPARTRALLYLVEIEGRTTADAAELVGMSGANARVVLMRARRRLRSELNLEASGE